MEIKEIETFFARQPYFSWIDLGGGEVTLRPDLPEIIKIIVSRSPHLVLLHFPTNGYLPESLFTVARLVKRLKVPRFIMTVSIDGPAPVHDRLRGMKGSFSKALESFEGLRRVEMTEAYLGMTLGTENSGLIEETFQSVKKVLGWVRKSDFHFNLAHNAFYYNNLETRVSPPIDLSRLLRRVSRWPAPRWSPQTILERCYLRLAEQYLLSGKSPLSCFALRASCFIDPSWQVFPCVGYERPLGNLRSNEFNLSRLWNGPIARKIREEIESGNCPQCWTPCEAYQSILGNAWSFINRRNFRRQPEDSGMIFK